MKLDAFVTRIIVGILTGIPKNSDAIFHWQNFNLKSWLMTKIKKIKYKNNIFFVLVNFSGQMILDLEYRINVQQIYLNFGF